MKRFKFRFEKVLEFREAAEEAARSAYLDAQAQRIEAEVFLGVLGAHRKSTLHERTETLEDRMAMERVMHKIDNDEQAQHTIIRVLTDEEGSAMAVWKEKKIELETMIKLKENALAEYKLEANRKEQNELDEWSSMRRKAG
jgi:flagellar export protein FliJ